MIVENRTERERNRLAWGGEKEIYGELMKTSKRQTNRNRSCVANPGPPSLSPPAVGFTLIELLVVIAIIGILAGLTVALSRTAAQKVKKDKTQAMLNKLATAIGGYKNDRGFYPHSNPSSPLNLNNNGRVNVDERTEVLLPAMNPLFYELVGTVFNRQTKSYTSIQGSAGLNPMQCQSFFGAKGFRNMTTNPGKTQSFIKLEDGEFALISEQPAANLLIAPGTWLLEEGSEALEQHRPIQSDQTVNNIKLKTLNPWQYRAPGINNRTSYDLWADVPIGNEVRRINNWGESKVINENN